MRKIINMITIIALVAAMALNLVGCGSSNGESPVNIAVIAGIADDETCFDEGIAELASLPSLPGSTYAFISLEGNPTSISAGSIPDLSDRGYTDTMMQHVNAGIMSDITSQLTDFSPTSSEIDIAASIELAVQSLNANAADGRQNMLVLYCSGKSTAGVINMNEIPVYRMDIDSSASAVAEEMNVDMSGIDVIWYCCGSFGANQPKLSPNEKAQLKSFYQQLLTTLGARSVSFKDNLPSSQCYHFPDTPVSSIEVEGGTSSGLKELTAESETSEEESEMVEELASPFETPIVIPEEKIHFKPDSADFLDQEAAKSAVQPIADLMALYPETILLYGTCASASDKSTETSLALGKKRAEAVASLLVDELGVEKERITVITLDYDNDPYFEFGRGTGDEGAVNRKVVVMDANSDLGQQILAHAE